MYVCVCVCVKRRVYFNLHCIYNSACSSTCTVLYLELSTLSEYTIHDSVAALTFSLAAFVDIGDIGDPDMNLAHELTTLQLPSEHVNKL